MFWEAIGLNHNKNRVVWIGITVFIGTQQTNMLRIKLLSLITIGLQCLKLRNRLKI